MKSSRVILCMVAIGTCSVVRAAPTVAESSIKDFDPTANELAKNDGIRDAKPAVEQDLLRSQSSDSGTNAKAPTTEAVGAEVSTSPPRPSFMERLSDLLTSVFNANEMSRSVSRGALENVVKPISVLMNTVVPGSRPAFKSAVSRHFFVPMLIEAGASQEVLNELDRVPKDDRFWDEVEDYLETVCSRLRRYIKDQREMAAEPISTTVATPAVNSVSSETEEMTPVNKDLPSAESGVASEETVVKVEHTDMAPATEVPSKSDSQTQVQTLPEAAASPITTTSPVSTLDEGHHAREAPVSSEPTQVVPNVDNIEDVVKTSPAPEKAAETSKASRAVNLSESKSEGQKESSAVHAPEAVPEAPTVSPAVGNPDKISETPKMSSENHTPEVTEEIPTAAPAVRVPETTSETSKASSPAVRMPEQIKEAPEASPAVANPEAISEVSEASPGSHTEQVSEAASELTTAQTATRHDNDKPEALQSTATPVEQRTSTHPIDEETNTVELSEPVRTPVADSGVTPSEAAVPPKSSGDLEQPGSSTVSSAEAQPAAERASEPHTEDGSSAEQVQAVPEQPTMSERTLPDADEKRADVPSMTPSSPVPSAAQPMAVSQTQTQQPAEVSTGPVAVPESSTMPTEVSEARATSDDSSSSATPDSHVTTFTSTSVSEAVPAVAAAVDDGATSANAPAAMAEEDSVATNSVTNASGGATTTAAQAPVGEAAEGASASEVPTQKSTPAQLGNLTELEPESAPTESVKSNVAAPAQVAASLPAEEAAPSALDSQKKAVEATTLSAPVEQQ